MQLSLLLFLSVLLQGTSGTFTAHCKWKYVQLLTEVHVYALWNVCHASNQPFPARGPHRVTNSFRQTTRPLRTLPNYTASTDSAKRANLLMFPHHANMQYSRLHLFVTQKTQTTSMHLVAQLHRIVALSFGNCWLVLTLHHGFFPDNQSFPCI